MENAGGTATPNNENGRTTRLDKPQLQTTRVFNCTSLLIFGRLNDAGAAAQTGNVCQGSRLRVFSPWPAGRRGEPGRSGCRCVTRAIRSALNRRRVRQQRKQRLLPPPEALCLLTKKHSQSIGRMPQVALLLLPPNANRQQAAAEEARCLHTYCGFVRGGLLPSIIRRETESS